MLESGPHQLRLDRRALRRSRRQAARNHSTRWRKPPRRRTSRIYTIGLRDQSYDPRTLKALAKAGKGEFARASVKSLAPLFDQLSRTISNEYLLQYKSLAGPEVPVRVTVRVKGLGADSISYRTPPLPATDTSTTPYQPSVGSDVWKSPITMIVIALLVAGVVAFLVIGLLRPRRSGLPARMAEFVSIRDLQNDKGQAAAADEEATAPADGLGAVREDPRDRRHQRRARVDRRRNRRG